jgi:hypothetical protein
MMSIVFVPYPVPVPMRGNGVGWEKRAKPAPYPREARERGRWPLNPVPVRDLKAARDLLADAKRLIAEDRASKLLRELDR